MKAISISKKSMVVIIMAMKNQLSILIMVISVINETLKYQ